MTTSPRLFDAMQVEATRLDRLAHGFRMTGCRRKARAATAAATQIRDAIAAIAVLSAIAGDDD